MVRPVQPLPVRPKATRQPGFYWVLFQGAEGEWEVCEWFEGRWYLTGQKSSAGEDEADEIDERRIERE